MATTDYVARFPLDDHDATENRAVLVVPCDYPHGGFFVRIEWADGRVVDSARAGTIGEALTLALDRAGLYDYVAARVMRHSVETARFVEHLHQTADAERASVAELSGSQLFTEHTGDAEAAQASGYFDTCEGGEPSGRPLMPGQNYRVRYRTPSGRDERVMVAQYLGPHSVGGGTDWSLRPHAGMQYVPAVLFVSAEPTDEAVAMPKRAIG